MSTSMQDNYFGVHETYDGHEICFSKHEIKFKNYTRYFWVVDKKQKKVIGVF